MKRLARFMLYLYPAEWRRRYQAELDALIEDSGSGWFAIIDLLKEAIRMQLTTWPFGKLAAAFSLAGCLLAVLIYARMPPSYSSQAQLEVSPVVNGQVHEPVLEMAKEAFSRPSLARIMADPRLDLYKSERESKPLEDVVDKMRHAIEVRILTPSRPASPPRSVFSLSFAYSDPIKAQKTVEALIARVMEANFKTNLGILAVLDPPSRPAKTSKPNRYLIALTGLAAGIVLAAAVRLLLRLPTAS